MYGLGAGIAHYLGSQLRFDILILGWIWVLALQLAAFFLHQYFDERLVGEKFGVLLFGFFPWNLTMISGSAFFLTVAASVFVVLIQQGSINREIITLGSMALVGVLLYTVPPVRLSKTGYGELSLAVLTCILVPVIGFLLQYGSLHRILAMAIFPVGLLHIALLMVFDFPEYARKLKFGDQSLLLRTGWQRGITLHNLFVLGSFLLIGIAALAGFPPFATWPSFLLLPSVCSKFTI